MMVDMTKRTKSVSNKTDDICMSHLLHKIKLVLSCWTVLIYNLYFIMQCTCFYIKYVLTIYVCVQHLHSLRIIFNYDINY